MKSHGRRTNLSQSRNAQAELDAAMDCCLSIEFLFDTPGLAGYQNGLVLVGWGRSSVGRAPQWHCGGQGFESPRLHHSLGCVDYKEHRSLKPCFRMEVSDSSTVSPRCAS